MPKKRIDIQLTQDERDVLEKFITQGKTRFPPDLVVNFQPIDITGTIFGDL